MEAFSFGSYYPGDSAIHRLDPRTKLLLGFVFLITTLTVSSFRGLVPVAIFVVLIYTVSRVPLRRVLSSMAPLLAIVVLALILFQFNGPGRLRPGRLCAQPGGPAFAIRRRASAVKAKKNRTNFRLKRHRPGRLRMPPAMSTPWPSG